MTLPQVEYLGFKTEGDCREYTLRARPVAGDWRLFTLAIASAAFVSRRVRYQDGPDICFLRLQRELASHDGGFPEAYLSISDAELEEYRAAHAPKPNQRR